jgi:hypothetical protein
MAAGGAGAATGLAAAGAASTLRLCVQVQLQVLNPASTKARVSRFSFEWFEFHDGCIVELFKSWDRKQKYIVATAYFA